MSIITVVDATLLEVVTKVEPCGFSESIKIAERMIRGEELRCGAISANVYHLLGDADAEYGGLRASSEIVVNNGLCSALLLLLLE